jgi:hypothetical protein
VAGAPRLVNVSGPRRIGSLGTTARVVLGVALLVLAVVLGVEPLDLALGLVVFPGVMVAIGFILRRDDQIGCPTMRPIDAWEARSGRSRSRPEV